ncbi:MAG TPA: hypothetical protein VH723_01885 [Candidatus Limnocylindrales bacterium]
MARLAVRLFHAEPATPGPFERLLVDARRAVAERHVAGFRRAGIDDVAVVSGPPDDTPFGVRLRELVEAERPDGLVVAGSGAIPLARAADLARFVATASAGRPVALVNNRYSADVVAVACAERLLELPDLPTDNALPRWLAERAGYEVTDLRARRHLQVDLDSPIDLLVAGVEAGAPELRAARTALERLAAVAADPRSELVVAGRSSASTLAWLEAHTAARTRALIEERGLRASGGPNARPPRSALGRLLDIRGPKAFGSILEELGEAAVVDTRVLLADRRGPDEHRWPSAEDRSASDLLAPRSIADPWLRDLTLSAIEARIPIVLGGHTVVGPGLPIVLDRLLPTRAKAR